MSYKSVILMAALAVVLVAYAGGLVGCYRDPGASAFYEEDSGSESSEVADTSEEDSDTPSEGKDSELNSATESETEPGTSTETETEPDTSSDTGEDSDTSQDTGTDTETDTETDTGVYDTPCNASGVSADTIYSRCWWEEEFIGTISGAQALCASLGPSWRVATVSDLRTIIRYCDKLNLGTACKVTNEAPNWSDYMASGTNGEDCHGCSHTPGTTGNLCFRLPGLEGDCSKYGHASATEVPDAFASWGEASRWYILFWAPTLGALGLTYEETHEVMWHCTRDF